MQIIDLTHPFTESTPVHPGDPMPEFMQIADVKNDGFNDVQVSTGMHVGTHIDAPGHMLWEGKLLSDYPIERFVGRGVLIDVRGKSVIGAERLHGVELRAGDIVLVLTGWSNKYHEPAYFEKFPQITEEFAAKLIEAGVSMLGTDTPSPDVEPYDIHRQLFEEDILVAENLNHLDQLANVGEFEVIALPVAYAANAAPARIIAQTNK